MAKAESGNKVQVHYSGRLDDDTVFDSSQGREPLEFIIGQGQLLPAFEQAVIGMEPGDSKTVRIVADEACGPRQREKIIDVARAQLPSDMPMEAGIQLRGSPQGGRPVNFTIVGVTESRVTLDGNHPLAGKDLTFEISLVQIL